MEPLSKASGNFARKSIASGINIILQKPKSDIRTSMKVQAYRFGKNQFTPELAKAWLKSNEIDYTLFEAASTLEKKEAIDTITKVLSDCIIEGRGDGVGTGGEKQGDGGTDTCVCPTCKEEVKHNRGTPCVEMTCPKCGASMGGK